MARNSTDLFASVDLGSAQTAAVAAVRRGCGFEIAGIGTAAAAGVEGGILTDIAAASRTLAAAVREAELQAAATLAGAPIIVGVPGAMISGRDEQAPVKIQGGTVTQGDVDLALDTLQAYPIPAEREILHVLQQSFSIDKRNDVRQPLGMIGNLLMAEAHIVTAPTNMLANIHSCLAGAGIRAGKVAAAPLAAAMSATSEDERDLGVIALDWGGGTCDIALFKQGVPRWFSSLPVGGGKIDLDIARTFRIPVSESERVKRSIGSAVQVPQSIDNQMQVTRINGEGKIDIDAQTLSMTIESRIDEMLQQIGDAIDSWFAEVSPDAAAGGGWRSRGEIGAGIVMTGGVANLSGIGELAHEHLGLPVRISAPRYAGAMHEEMCAAELAAAHGLLMLLSDAQAAAAAAPRRDRRGLLGRFLASFVPRRQST